MTSSLAPVRSAPISGQQGRQAATNALRKAIANGELRPAQRLVELELAERFGVTRSSVRAALMDLATDGLVESTPNRGAVVRVVTIDEAIAITEVRMHLEGLCAAKAAERATPAEAKELRAIGREMRAAVRSADFTAYARLNIQLHTRVREIGHQPVASDLLDRLNGQLVRHRFQLSRIAGRPSVSLGEHLEIIDAVAKGDPDRAMKAMHIHLGSVIDTLRATPEAHA